MSGSSKKGPLLNFEDLTSNNIEDDLKKLDSFLACSICSKYFDTCTVITKCSHNFCAQCIQRKNACPICDIPLRDSQLRPNKIVDDFVSILPSLKSNMIRYLRTLKTFKPNTLYISPSEGKSESKSDVKELRKTKTKKERIAVFVDPGTNDSLHDESTQRLTIPAMFFSQVTKSQSATRPVPSINVPKTEIKRPMDSCKCSESKQRSPKKGRVQNADGTISRRTRLPILVTHLMTQKELKAKAREYGLNPQGNREKLKKRIERYTFLFNANCKKADPLPSIKIIRMIEKEEKRRDRKRKIIESSSDEEKEKTTIRKIEKKRRDRKRRVIASSSDDEEEKSTFQKIAKEEKRRDRKRRVIASSSDEEEERTIPQISPDNACYEPSVSTNVPTIYEYSASDPASGEIKLDFEVGSEEDTKRNFEWGNDDEDFEKDHGQLGNVKLGNCLADDYNEYLFGPLTGENTKIKIKLEPEMEMDERRYPKRSSRSYPRSEK